MHAWNLHAREPGGPLTARRRWCAGTRRKGHGRNLSMNEQGKSHRPRVPTKPPNEGGPTASEAVEGQGLVKENARQQNTHRTQCRARVHSALEGVRQIAKRDKEVKFTALFHHIRIDRLRLAFMETNRKAAMSVRRGEMGAVRGRHPWPEERFDATI